MWLDCLTFIKDYNYLLLCGSIDSSSFIIDFQEHKLPHQCPSPFLPATRLNSLMFVVLMGVPMTAK